MKTRTFVAVMGAWMGAAGLEHGIGEILQGSARPAGIWIQSWPGSPFFASLGGEPALTVLPSLLGTGLLACLFSILYIAVAIRFADRAWGGPVMMLLTVPMLLFGAGLFPPVLGLLVGLAATRIGKPDTRPAGRLARGLSRVSGWLFAAMLLAWLALLPGIPALHYFWGFENSTLTLAVLVAALSLLALVYAASRSQDMQANRNR